MIDVSARLAEGCASTAWVCGLYMIHNWLLTLFPESVQDEIWSENPGVSISGSYAPAGTATAVDGGYRLSGRFRFSSGCPHADWNLCSAMLPTGAGDTRIPAFTLIPRADYAIDWDSWDNVGLSATGSYDVLVDDAFLPAAPRAALRRGHDGKRARPSGPRQPALSHPHAGLRPLLSCDFRRSAPRAGPSLRSWRRTEAARPAGRWSPGASRCRISRPSRNASARPKP